MIRIHHNELSLENLAKEFLNIYIIGYLDVKTKIKTGPNNGWPKELLPVIKEIESCLEEIIISPPSKLEQIISKLEPMIDLAKNQYDSNQLKKLSKGKLNNWIKENLGYIFNYNKGINSFINFVDPKGIKIAYLHSEKLNINTCLYCNTNYTFTIRKKDLNCRPQFDHFYAKGKYPYLAVSFYNLIPSCSLCNSGALKGSKIFNLKNNLHPFIDSFNSVLRFRTNIDSVDFITNKTNFTIKLDPIPNLTKERKALLKRAKKNKKIFALENRYNQHIDMASEIIKKAYVYNNTSIEDIWSEFKVNNQSIFKNKGEVKQLVFGNLLDENQYHYRIHSKFVTDIADEFGIRI